MPAFLAGRGAVIFPSFGQQSFVAFVVCHAATVSGHRVRRKPCLRRTTRVVSHP